MKQQVLTPEQLSVLKEITNPVIRRRFALFHQMPSDLQEKFFAEETTDTIWSTLRDRYGLADSNLIAVSRIVGLVMLGELPLKDFIPRLAQDLDIESSLAAKIAHDINQLVFQPVRESLMAVHGLKAEDTRDKRQDTKTPGMPPPTPMRTERVPSPIPIPAPKVPEPKPFDTAQSKPVPLQELDKRPTPTRPPEPAIPSTAQEKENEKRRQELIERLKTSNKKQETRDKKQGVTAAWNGRTIDLTKIPPRREVNSNGKYKKNGVRYLDPRDLYES